MYGRPLTDEEEAYLRRRIRDGDDAEGARNRLVVGVVPFCALHASRAVRRGEDVQELLSEIMLEVVKASRRFDPDSPHRWLLRVFWACRTGVTRWRQQRPIVPGACVGLEDDDCPDPECTRPGPADLAGRRETVQRVRSAVASLDPRREAAVRHVYLRQMTLERAGWHLGITREAVRQRVAQALKTLRVQLGPEFGPETRPQDGRGEPIAHPPVRWDLGIVKVD